MKDIFKGYYKLKPKEIANIWSNGFISLDANVLFNLYRYSDETRKELIKVIDRYKSRLWISYQAANEFQNSRISVISDQIITYEKTISEVNNLIVAISKNLKSPHLSKQVLKSFEATMSLVIKDLGKKKLFYENLLKHDTILNLISSIFKDKIGDSFDEIELKQIEKEGEVRYSQQIPPGYKDAEKKRNKFGDLILWKEMVRKSKNDNEPFIFISDDYKEDWWLKVQGKTLSPRFELSQELYKEAKQSFLLYTPDRFLEYVSKTSKVKKETINEVREKGGLDLRPSQSLLERLKLIQDSNALIAYNPMLEALNSSPFGLSAQSLANMNEKFQQYLDNTPSFIQNEKLRKLWEDLKKNQEGKGDSGQKTSAEESA